MPSSILSADTGFPSFTGEETAEERDEIILNYLYMLLEQLRYSLSNIGVDNFNDTELEEILDTAAESTITTLTSEGGTIATLIQTAELLASTIEDVEGNVSEIAQTVSGIGLSVSNGTTSSTITLTADGVAIASAEISFSGYVTFTNLETEGETVIYGGNVSTDTLQVSNLYGKTIYLRTADSLAAGYFAVTGADTSDFEILMRSYGAMELLANEGAVFIEAYSAESDSDLNSYVQLGASNVSFGPSNCTVRPSTDASQTLGNASYRWSTIYSSSSSISTSDRRQKRDIDYRMRGYDLFFDSLQPCSYRHIDGDRRHTGLIAQDVEAALQVCGMTADDFGGLCRDELEGGGDLYGLRYEEFIALLIWQVQQLKARTELLEHRVTELEEAMQP